MPRPHYKSAGARLPSPVGGGVGLGVLRLSVSCIISGYTRPIVLQPGGGFPYAIEDRLLGQMIACATMTDSPLNVAVGEP